MMTTLLTWLTVSTAVAFLLWIVSALRQSARDEARAAKCAQRADALRRPGRREQ